MARRTHLEAMLKRAPWMDRTEDRNHPPPRSAPSKYQPFAGDSLQQCPRPFEDGPFQSEFEELADRDEFVKGPVSTLSRVTDDSER